MELDYIKLGKRIRAIRMAKGLTQEKLAEKSDLSANHISHIERANTMVGLPTLVQIAVCDDEEEFCQKIKNSLEKTVSNDDEIKYFNNGIELLNHMRKDNFDIVYLDIEMPSMNGIETAEQLLQINRGILIIFVSSYSCYISKAFKLDAFQFLIKEFADENEIISEYSRAKEKFRIEHYLYSIKKKEETINTIAYIESKNRHLYAVTIDGQEHEFRSKMNDEEKKLKAFNFVRIYESVLVNMIYIRRIDSSSLTLKYHIGKQLPISRRYKESLMNKYNLYISGHSI